MKLKELLNGVTPQADFEGFVTNDDFILAINITPSVADVKVEDYEVLEMGMAGLDAQVNPISSDKIYIRAGQSTTKTGTQRTFAVSGDRYIGDPAQDYCLGYDGMYATGQNAITDYVYICMKNFQGEKGKVTILTNSDGGGNAGENAAFSVDLKKSGALPEKYTYEQPVTP